MLAQKIVNAVSTKKPNTAATTLSNVRRSLCSFALPLADSFEIQKGSFVDKYESLLPLNGLLRTPKEGEKHLRTFAQSAQNVNLKWMLEAAAEKCAASAEQLRARTRGLRRKPVSAGSVSGAIGSDDHVILAESERKQHMAKNEYEGERDLAQIDESSPLPHELHR